MFYKKNLKSPVALEGLNPSSDAASLRAKLENERLSRRQALRKMGVISGMAVFSLLTVDDLARMAAKQLASASNNSELADSLANSLRNAGVAIADPYTDPYDNPFFGTQDPTNPNWSENDCETRCLWATNESLIMALNGQLSDQQLTGIKKYCDEHTHGLQDRENYRLTGILAAANNKFSMEVYSFLDCCEKRCQGDMEGVEHCKGKMPHNDTAGEELPEGP